jgi:ribosome-binding protein aMBF1 (putative translation factor)
MKFNIHLRPIAPDPQSARASLPKKVRIPNIHRSEGKIMTEQRDAPDDWPTDPEEFGNRVQTEREKVGLTRPWLAKEAGLPEVTLRNIKRGRPASELERKRLIYALTWHRERQAKREDNHE